MDITFSDYIETFIVEYTYNSIAIEGNSLSMKEVELVLQGQTIEGKPLKDHMEAVGHKEAFDFVLELVKNNTPITESVINTGGDRIRDDLGIVLGVDGGGVDAKTGGDLLDGGILSEIALIGIV